MAKRSQLVSETTMYSVNPGSGEVVVHHLPWPRTSPQLETYTAKGFSFDRPPEVLIKPVGDSEILGARVFLDNAPVPRRGRRLHDGEKVVAVTCDFPGCKFIAKSEFGLTVHQRRHSKVKV